MFGRELSLSRLQHLLQWVNSISFSSVSSLQSDTQMSISSAVSILRDQHSKSRWNFLQSLFPSGFTPAEFSEITLKIRNNPHLALRFFHWTQTKSLCNHNLLSYSTIIHILARARFKSHAQTIIQVAIRVTELDQIENFDQFKSRPPKIFETLAKTYRSCDSAPFVFDLLIKACSQSNRINQSIAIVRMLRSRGIYPKISTFNFLIGSVIRSRGCDEGFDVYREVFSLNDEVKENVCRIRVCPNVQTFNLLMVSFYQKGLMENVKEIWSEMEKLNCAPNAYSYSILMAVFCEEGKMNDAQKLFVAMQGKQINPDVVAYNTLISGYCKIGEINRAEELCRDMGLSGIESTCITYEHLVNGYCKIGDVDSAILVYNDMCRKGFRPEGFVIDVLIKMLCDNSRVYEALEFCRVAMAKYNVLPSRSSYKFLIQGLCEEGKMEEALKLQAEMVGRGFEPNSEIYGAFIDGHVKLGHIELAERLRMEMLDMLSRKEEK